MRERTFFETWQRLAFDNKLGQFEYYDMYIVGGLQIHQLDQNDRKDTV